MFLLKLINYIRGYLLVTVDGYFLERFINMCIRGNIFIWDIHKMSSTQMRVKISVKAFRQIRTVARRTKSRVRVYRRRGLPFIVHKYRKRRGILIGLCVFLVMMWYFTAFVSGIEIIGNQIVESEVIEQYLAEFGVRPGRMIRNIDERSVENRLMSTIPELSWVALNIQGSKIFVEIQERAIIPPRIPADVPTNIVASRSGFIEMMNIRSGQSVVSIDDSVSEGDLLVSGIADFAGGGARFVHSFGEVFARTWYEATADFPLVFEERVNTGRERNKRSIRFMNFQINLYISRRIPYTIYERTRTIDVYQIPFLPRIEILRNTFSEQRIVPRERTLEDVLIIADFELRTQIESELPLGVEVIEVSMTHEFITPELVRVTMVYTCRENIARQVLIEVADDGAQQ